ncbi:MAG: hypothetical protein M3Y35_10345 [Actinomycetota bacterium]|nr:hypothetical protein [Actinomycetota bacterium]
MTTTARTRVNWEDLRVGDLVRLSTTWGGVTKSYEGMVAGISAKDNLIYLGDIWESFCRGDSGKCQWTVEVIRKLRIAFLPTSPSSPGL